MSSVTLDAATRVIREKVQPIEVARYYLKTEFPNIIKTTNQQTLQDIGSSVDALDDKELWRLLEALSYTYRANSIYRFLTDQAYDWAEAELPIEQIKLTGMSESFNTLVYSNDIDRNPFKLVTFLQKYYSDNQTGGRDPLGLDELQPSNKQVDPPLLITTESEGGISIADGMHRLIEYAHQGVRTARVYAGIRNGRPHRYAVGDSTFLTLRNLYESLDGDAAAQAKVIEVTALLADFSITGKGSVQTYWVDHVLGQKRKEAGQRVLSAMSKLGVNSEFKQNNR